MAMNLRNPIQLLRGTGKAIESASSNEGTMFYDTEKGIFRVKRTDGGLYDSVRAWGEVSSSPTIYVDSVNGNDANRGFTEDSPLQSFDKAIYLCELINSTAFPNIVLADGVYTTTLRYYPSCYIRSKSGNKQNCVIHCGNILPRGKVNINNVTLDITASSDSAIQNESNALAIGNCRININSDVYAAILSSNTSYTYIDDTDFYLNGKNFSTVISTSFGSSLNINSKCRFYGGANCSIAFVFAANNSYIEVDNDAEFSGTYVGRRYRTQYDSIINTFGAGENFFPGDSAGLIASGGTYY